MTFILEYFLKGILLQKTITGKRKKLNGVGVCGNYNLKVLKKTFTNGY